MGILEIVLTSSLVSGLTITIVNSIFLFFFKKYEHKKAYQSKIIDKRIMAYDYMNDYMAVFYSLTNEDGIGIYHSIFNLEIDEFQSKYLWLTDPRHNIWLSQNLVNIRFDINKFIYNVYFDTDIKQRILYGRMHFEEISELHAQFSKQLILDYNDMYNFDGFVKKMKTDVLKTREI